MGLNIKKTCNDILQKYFNIPTGVNIRSMCFKIIFIDYRGRCREIDRLLLCDSIKQRLDVNLTYNGKKIPHTKVQFTHWHTDFYGKKLLPIRDCIAVSTPYGYVVMIMDRFRSIHFVKDWQNRHNLRLDTVAIEALQLKKEQDEAKVNNANQLRVAKCINSINPTAEIALRKSFINWHHIHFENLFEKKILEQQIMTDCTTDSLFS
jgi:hypothetical protein